MMRAYGPVRFRCRHLPDSAIVALAGAVVIGVWTRSVPVAVATAPVLTVLTRRAGLGALCGLLATIGVWAGSRAWDQAQPRVLGPYQGWAMISTDPVPIGSGVRVTVEIQGERFDCWVYGGARRRVSARQAGEWLLVDGTRRPLGANARRAQVRHVVGRFEADTITDWSSGSPLGRGNVRVRAALRHAAERTMSDARAALFTGLVIGDDARQPVGMQQAFRGSGLSHLTAVSGQNVAFVLAAAAPLLRRLRSWWRFGLTVVLIAWFMALTRFEPSILRAGVMAMLAAGAFVTGKERAPLRLLAVAVGLLALADPLLVWSVGFWLSVCATAGVAGCGPWLGRRLPGPTWLTSALGVTLGAQLGVALPSLLVFHRLPIVSLPANLLAVPVAGFVMLYGIPAGLVAAAAPGSLARLVMAPAVAGTGWVAGVAEIGARVEPSPPWAGAGWGVVAVALVIVLWRGRLARRWRPPAAGVTI